MIFPLFPFWFLGLLVSWCSYLPSPISSHGPAQGHVHAGLSWMSLPLALLFIISTPNLPLHHTQKQSCACGLSFSSTYHCFHLHQYPSGSTADLSLRDSDHTQFTLLQRPRIPPKDLWAAGQPAHQTCPGKSASPIMDTRLLPNSGNMQRHTDRKTSQQSRHLLPPSDPS